MRATSSFFYFFLFSRLLVVKYLLQRLVFPGSPRIGGRKIPGLRSAEEKAVSSSRDSDAEGSAARRSSDVRGMGE